MQRNDNGNSIIRSSALTAAIPPVYHRAFANGGNIAQWRNASNSVTFA